LIVVFGGQSAEHDVSCTSARHVLAAIDTSRYTVEAWGITRGGRWVQAEEALAALEQGAAALPQQLVAEGPTIDPLPVLANGAGDTTVVFPVLHGPQGEDGTIQGLLELANVAYVGCGVLSSALCMDKIKSKEAFDHCGLPQPRWLGFHESDRSGRLEDRIVEHLGLPLFVKPANMGSSVGVSKVSDRVELAEALDVAGSYDEWIVVEEAIVGREIECSVLGNLHPDVSVAGEIRSGADFYDYSDKYDDGAELVIPAPLGSGELEQMQSLARQAFRALRCEGLARIDFFYEPDGRGWLINEVNTMPGFTPISMYPKLWDVSGVPYSHLIDRLVALAVERHDRRQAHRRTDH
jgi:D-alanine-D-alanine ligase